MKTKMKTKNIIYLSILILIGILSCLIFVRTDSINSNKNKELNYINNFKEFKNINSDGSFVIYSDNKKDFKIKKSFSKKKNIDKYEWYMDAYCSDCVFVHEKIGKDVEKLILDEKIEVKFHPLNFLSHKQTNNSSLKSASVLSGIAEYSDGNDVIFFMNKIMNSSYRSTYKVMEEPYDLFYKTFSEIDDNQEKIKEIKKNIIRLEYAINSASVNIRRREDLTNKSPKADKSFYVPFIFKVGENTKAFIGESDQPEIDILNEINKGETEKEFQNLQDLSIKPCKEGCT